MDHEPVLISTIAVGLMAAFVGGFIAKRIGLPTIVGYIVAGVLLGPFTPGFSADVDLALELADIGIILLMFGVGIHFSLRDLAAVRAIAIPGALIQIVIATILGLMLGLALGWGIGGGLVLGLSLSVASTVVLLRALTDRGEVDTSQGRIEQHAHRHEEEDGEGVPQRQCVGGGLMAHIRLPDHRPGEEGSECERDAEDRRRQEGKPDRDGQHGQREQLARPLTGDEEQQPRHEPRPGHDHEDGEDGGLAHGQHQFAERPQTGSALRRVATQ